ncbi:methylmalonyl Co-A mutase-associated GTPase MeaB [Actinoplanes subglobosus]|uniref:Methylmalonyl Co-A mutase-associated GTPase MeaB n=1 Tax=Actinoplanes subglobosus TaxID=1547892 RepID=A0ABV8J357_9ACTN
MRATDLSRAVEGVLAGDRVWVARALTLVESIRPDHRDTAERLLGALTPHAGHAVRVGVSGPPGVGKSTFVEALGTTLTAGGRRVAVLAVDPSSPRGGGSILGDRTRMGRLAADPAAFVRPSPSAGTLGGVTAATRAAIVVMEAAGYDVVLVETVGVGQSETAVAAMVDTLLLLAQPGAGDELQGVKRGVLEFADVIAVTKADGSRAADARRAAAELSTAMRLLHPSGTSWRPPVLTCSAVENTGITDVWAAVTRHRAASGHPAALAEKQAASLWALLQERVMAQLRADPEVRRLLPDLQRRVRTGGCSATEAAEHLVQAFRGGISR